MVKNLSHPTYRGDGRTKPPTIALVKKPKSSYQQGDEQTKPLTSALVKNLSHPTYKGDGLTKPPMCALVKKPYVILPTVGIDKPSINEYFDQN